MKDRRYLLVLLDPRGRTLRRLPIQRRSVLGAAATLGLSLLVGMGLGLHGLSKRSEAREALRLQEENRNLRALHAQVAQRLPGARILSAHAELSFAQLWAKSGLGPEPTALGVGPVGDDLEGNTTTADFHRTMTLQEVPLELDRMASDGPQLQNLLGELLEYFHDAERLLSNTPSIKPARTRWKTSSFGRRNDPITGQILMHKGVDLAGATGDPIYAPADGVVIFTGYRGGYGLVVVIDHGFGLQTHFAHLNRTRVSVGERVKRGHIIADMGSTGKSTGPHLHYEVRRMGQPVDPANFIMD